VVQGKAEEALQMHVKLRDRRLIGHVFSGATRSFDDRVALLFYGHMANINHH
jgi:hypothetical protein